MSEQPLSGGGPVPDSAPICPWCSAVLPSPAEERCPSCGAALREANATEVPGVTRVDHEALLRGRMPAQRSRGLIGWISGEYEVEAPTPPPGTLEPPANEVRREMLRLELAALEAEVQARQTAADALAAAAREAASVPAVSDPAVSELDVTRDAAADAATADVVTRDAAADAATADAAVRAVETAEAGEDDSESAAKPREG